MNITHIGAATVLVAVALLGATPTVALGSAVDAAPLTQRTAPPVVVDDDAEVRAHLLDLAATQSPSDVEAIMGSGEQVQAFYDVEADTYTAAFVEQRPAFTPGGISQRGPGCATGDACVVNKTIGFYGTGQKTFAPAISGVSKVYAGDRVTTWWRSATVGIHQDKYVTTTLSAPVTVVSITRS
jgi:hypothetical protein